MRKTVHIAVFLLAFLAIAAQGQDTFMVMSVKGKVESTSSRSKTWKKVSVGIVLGDNDIIRTSFASYVKIMVNGARLVSIDENTSKPLKEFGTKKKAGTEQQSPTGSLLQYAAEQFSKNKSRKGGSDFGAVRGGMEIFSAVFPKSNILTPTPSFQWVDSDSGSAYDVMVVDENFTTIGRAKVSGKSITLDTTNLKLQDGKTYHWRVSRIKDGESSDIQSFHIMQHDTVTAIREEVSRLNSDLLGMGADEITIHLIKAVYYEKKALYCDAFNEYKETIRLAPDVEEYRDMMRSLLMNLRLYNEEEFLLR